MRRVLIFCAAIVALVTAGTAHAKDVRPYFTLEVGAAVNSESTVTGDVKSSFDPGLAAGAAVGLDFEAVRIEAEFGYRKSDISEVKALGVTATPSGNLQVMTYMVNAYLVAPLDSPLKPYLVGGAGFATGSLSSILGLPSANDTKFAYQGGVGVGFDIKRNITLDASYRYLATSDFSFNDDKWSYGSHNMLFGVRYSF